MVQPIGTEAQVISGPSSLPILLHNAVSADVERRQHQLNSWFKGNSDKQLANHSCLMLLDGFQKLCCQCNEIAGSPAPENFCFIQFIVVIPC